VPHGSPHSVFVSVVVNGALVTGSVPAVLSHGTVVAPLDPYVRAIATRLSFPVESDTIVVQRGSRILTLSLGSRRARTGPSEAELPIAPYLRAGAVIIPLATTARALGATVGYDARSQTLAIAFPELPLATLAPASPAPPPPAELRTFAPTPTPAPQPTITGIPKPRRTPIPIGSDG
jgi:hypothetical protein